MNYKEETTMYNGNENEDEDKYSNKEEAPKSESQLGVAFRSQGKIIENLCREIHLLREQLAPVLIPQDEEPATRAEELYPSELCVIAERLYEHGHILERATRDIAQTRKALAV